MRRLDVLDGLGHHADAAGRLIARPRAHEHAVDTGARAVHAKRASPSASIATPGGSLLLLGVVADTSVGGPSSPAAGHRRAMTATALPASCVHVSSASPVASITTCGPEKRSAASVIVTTGPRAPSADTPRARNTAGPCGCRSLHAATARPLGATASCRSPATKLGSDRSTIGPSRPPADRRRTWTRTPRLSRRSQPNVALDRASIPMRAALTIPDAETCRGDVHAADPPAAAASAGSAMTANTAVTRAVTWHRTGKADRSSDRVEHDAYAGRSAGARARELSEQRVQPPKPRTPGSTTRPIGWLGRRGCG